MSSRLKERLQGSILARSIREEPDCTDREIAGLLGRCRSWISKARSGDRDMTVLDLAALVRRFGAASVLTPLAALDGCVVVDAERPAAPAATEAFGASLDAAAVATSYAQLMREAMSDGVISAAEHEALAAKVEALITLAQRSVPAVGRLH